MNTLKPDFIATARACRRHWARAFKSVDAGKRDALIELIHVRCARLHRLYLKQIKIPA